MRNVVPALPLLIALLGGVALPDTDTTGTFALASGNVLEVVFFDVGQGDCAVVMSSGPNPTVVVIDGGFVSTARTSVVPFLRARGVSAIDLMIMTHPDMDHVSGLRRLIAEFEVREIWDPGFDHDTGTYNDFVCLAQAEAADRYYRPFEEQIVESIALDTDDASERIVVLGEPESFGAFEIIPLHSSEFLDGPTEAYRVNNSSIVVKVVFGENSILFTGDANGRSANIEDDERESEVHFTEAALLELEEADPGLLRSTVVKVPHHGSLTSSSHQFVEAVSPLWAVVSSGITSSALPRAATLSRYSEIKSNILRTDVGDVSDTKGDDHLVLIMGEGEGDLFWHQADTRSLLERLGV